LKVKQIDAEDRLQQVEVKQAEAGSGKSRLKQVEAGWR
jgi:hypothetical protein